MAFLNLISYPLFLPIMDLSKNQNCSQRLGIFHPRRYSQAL
jgi:hypothetical protein